MSCKLLKMPLYSEPPLPSILKGSIFFLGMEKKNLILTGFSLSFSRMEEYLHRKESWSYTTDTAGNFSQQSSFCQTPAFKWSFIAPILKFLTPHFGRVSPPQSLSTAIPASLQLYCYYCVWHFSKQNKIPPSKNMSVPVQMHLHQLLPGKKYFK